MHFSQKLPAPKTPVALSRLRFKLLELRKTSGCAEIERAGLKAILTIFNCFRFISIQSCSYSQFFCERERDVRVRWVPVPPVLSFAFFCEQPFFRSFSGSFFGKLDCATGSWWCGSTILVYLCNSSTCAIAGEKRDARMQSGL